MLPQAELGQDDSGGDGSGEWQANDRSADSSTSSRSIASLMADNSFAEWLALERSSSRLGGGGTGSRHSSGLGSPQGGAHSPRAGRAPRHPDTVPGAPERGNPGLPSSCTMSIRISQGRYAPKVRYM